MPNYDTKAKPHIRKPATLSLKERSMASFENHCMKIID